MAPADTSASMRYAEFAKQEIVAQWEWREGSSDFAWDRELLDGQVGL